MWGTVKLTPIKLQTPEVRLLYHMMDTFRFFLQVLGANIVESSSKMFTVYSIAVTDESNHSWSIKRRWCNITFTDLMLVLCFVYIIYSCDLSDFDILRSYTGGLKCFRSTIFIYRRSISYRQAWTYLLFKSDVYYLITISRSNVHVSFVSLF